MGEKGLLEKGITSQGMMSRGYDKEGKRMHMATPKEAGRPESHDLATTMKSTKVDAETKAVDSDTVRKDVGTN